MADPEQKPESVFIGEPGKGRSFLDPEIAEKVRIFEEMDPEERRRLFLLGRVTTSNERLERIRTARITETFRGFGFDDQEIEGILAEVPRFDYLSNEAKGELFAGLAARINEKLAERGEVEGINAEAAESWEIDQGLEEEQ